MKLIKTKTFTKSTKKMHNVLAEIDPFIITHNCTYRNTQEMKGNREARESRDTGETGEAGRSY